MFFVEPPAIFASNPLPHEEAFGTRLQGFIYDNQENALVGRSYRTKTLTQNGTIPYIMKQVTENDIQNAVCEYLTYKRHFFWRQNTTGVYDPAKKTFRKLPKYAMKGVPDIIVITDGGYAVFLEIKKKSGYLSPEQKTFQALCKERGAEYYCIRDVAELAPLGL